MWPPVLFIFIYCYCFVAILSVSAIMLSFVCFIVFKSRYKRNRNPHILQYKNNPTGIIIADAIFKYLYSKGQVCAFVIKIGY